MMVHYTKTSGNVSYPPVQYHLDVSNLCPPYDTATATDLVIHIKSYITSHNTYYIANSHVGGDTLLAQGVVDPAMYNSVIVDASTHEVYAFSPPKSASLDTFIQTVSGGTGENKDRPIVDLQRTVVTEVVEGTMVNLWYDRRAKKWEISTKTAVGGGYTYVRDHKMDDVDPFKHATGTFSCVPGYMNFLQMFVEALVMSSEPGVGKEAHDTTFSCETYSGHLNQLLNQWRWSKRYCYSFVLQHPHNRLVLNVTVPRVALVAVYRKQEERRPRRQAKHNVVIEAVDPRIFKDWECFRHAVGVFFPTMPYSGCESLTYADLLRPYYSIHSQIDQVGHGIMLYDTVTGIRAKVTSAVYKEYKEKCGIPSNLLFQYACLNHTGKVDTFLQYFPFYSAAFDTYKNIYHSLMFNLYESYVLRYRMSASTPISPRFLPHVDYLYYHVYLPEKTAAKKRGARPLGITLTKIREYLDGLHPTLLFQAMQS